MFGKGFDSLSCNKHYGHEMDFLTLSSIYTHFNTLKKKDLRKYCGKSFRHFSMQSVSLNPLIAIFQLWSAAQAFVL